jgi:hypothetical protein
MRNFPLKKHHYVLYSIALVLSAWAVTTWMFWVGYVGTDDIFYARYAFLFHRPPINWWEFRMPAILAIRVSFLLFGATPFAAAVPSLLASLAILGSVAWFVGWPLQLNWKTQTSMLIAATLPFDVAYRSVPGATHLAGAFLAMGTVLLLKGKRSGQMVGTLFLTFGFLTHEVSIFYIVLLCGSAVVLNRRRYVDGVISCVAFLVIAIVAEGVVYQVLLGDPFARYRMAGTSSSHLPIGFDPDNGIGGMYFYVWPMQNLVFGNSFSFDLLLLIVGATLSWKYLWREQLILLVATCLTLGWLGYGTLIPWTYHPLPRALHYYYCLTPGVAALLPAVWEHRLGEKRRLAVSAVGLVIVAHILCLAAGGRWAQEVRVSRELLTYAKSHSDRIFLTDVRTMNEMYALDGFQLPKNVVCLNGPAVENNLRVNKEPPGTARYRFPSVPLDAILVNFEAVKGGTAETEFLQYLAEHGKQRVFVIPKRYKLLFTPVASLIGSRELFIKSLGGEVVMVDSRS